MEENRKNGNENMRMIQTYRERERKEKIGEGERDFVLRPLKERDLLQLLKTIDFTDIDFFNFALTRLNSIII